MTVEDYLRSTNTPPWHSNDISGLVLPSHPIEIPADEKEMDYMRAAAIATNNQRALERAAAALGMEVEEYMESNDMLTDTHLAPWAR